ncbi:serine/threonine-protein kinase [Polyangium jinanense]|uniref:Serine/threonine protein kinase n=1 Tax=Polyangium jinanense TaxID=2829994 RepID=A0A9X3X2D3_9BACT|nr:serine/threonine-protein kinase [Polyangium jinanense]MDC3982914.1 serine/threonine protein kinase [Polyangium jinanense]
MLLPRPELLEPETLFHGRYRVIRPIKSGGMGTVYEVVDEKTSSRRALKVMLPNLVSSEEGRKRFELEARATGAIESDHIVRIVDVGIDPGTELPFLVMELLRGRDLGAILDQGIRLTVEDVLRYLAQTALALDKLHAAGVVHRDLKPENVFVSWRDDGTPCVKVLDFGVVKTEDPVVAGITTRGILGTPIYMAPEQVEASRDIGPAADIYALGQLAYELLVGEPYWSEELERDGSPILLAADISAGPRESPEARAKRRKRVDLPAGFDSWFAGATAKSVEARFPRATLAIAALTDLVRESARPSVEQVPSAKPKSSASRSAAAPPPAREVAKKGFLVTVDGATNVVRVDVWGFWDLGDGKGYWEEFERKTRPLLGKPWYVLANISNFPPQKPEVSAFIEKTMTHARQHGLVRAANLISSALGRMQIQRLSVETGLPVYSFFTTEGEALRWLLTGK